MFYIFFPLICYTFCFKVLLRSRRRKRKVNIYIYNIYLSGEFFKELAYLTVEDANWRPTEKLMWQLQTKAVCWQNSLFLERVLWTLIGSGHTQLGLQHMNFEGVQFSFKHFPYVSGVNESKSYLYEYLYHIVYIKCV